MRSLEFDTVNVVCHFLRAFAKLRKATITYVRPVRLSLSLCLSLCLSVCLPVCLSVRMEQLGSHWTDFDLFFLKPCR